MINVRGVKMLCNCTRTSCKIILKLDRLIEIGISSSAVILKVVIKLKGL